MLRQMHRARHANKGMPSKSNINVLSAQIRRTYWHDDENIYADTISQVNAAEQFMSRRNSPVNALANDNDDDETTVATKAMEATAAESIFMLPWRRKQ